MLAAVNGPPGVIATAAHVTAATASLAGVTPAAVNPFTAIVRFRDY